MVQLRTLGTFGILAPGRTAEVVPAERSHAAILAILAAEGTATLPLLQRLLWPHRDPERARHALRRCIRELNDVLGLRGIHLDGEVLRLDAEVSVDALEFQRAVEAGDYATARALYRGPFLGNAGPDVPPELGEWLHAHRERLARLYETAIADDAQPSAPAPGVGPPGALPYPLRLLAELRRRRVVRVAAVYFVFAWGTIQVADTVLPRLGVDDWAVTLVIFLAAAGFPLAVALAWAFELTAEGAVRPERASAGIPWFQQRSLSRRLILVPLALVAFFTVVLWGSVRIPAGPGDDAPLDDQLYAVLPFEDFGESAAQIGGRTLQLLFRDAIRDWQDVAAVEDILLNDALQRVGTANALTLEGHRAVARAVGAGRLLLGRYEQRGDSLYITASLWAVAGDSRRAVATESFAVDAGLSNRAPFANMLNRLLSRDARADFAAAGTPTTNVLEALVEFGRGDSARAVWDLERAAAHYRRAVALDPDFALGWLHLSQVKAWRKLLDAEWKRAASEAARLADRMAEPEATLARAASALAEERYAEACALYQQAELEAPRNFDARIGLGNCHAWDEVVVEDTLRPGHYAFRSSYEAAFRAYRQAIELVPSANFALANRLDSLLYVHNDQLRRGHLVTDRNTRFLAFPSLAGDTLAFVPHRREAVNAGLPGTRPSVHARTIERNRTVLQQIFADWARAFPQHAQSRASYARVLESLGELQPKGQAAGAFSENAAALAMETDPHQRLRLSMDRVRMLVKLEQFEGARAAADSLLRAYPAPSAPEAELLSGAAALTGRARLAADLLERAAPRQQERLARSIGHVPGPVVEAAQRLLAFAAIGGPVDSLRATSERAVRRVTDFVAPRERDAARRAMLDRPFALAFLSIGPGWAHEDSVAGYTIIEMQKALVRGDEARVRRMVADAEREFAAYRTGDLHAELAYNVAQVRMAIGDTIGAADRLDAFLRNLAMGNPRLLDPVEAAALIRAMQFRADIAEARDDHDVARRWNTVVATLWRNADPGLMRLQEIPPNR